MDLTFENQSQLQIRASPAPSSNGYISGVSINGAPWDSTWIPLSALQNAQMVNELHRCHVFSTAIFPGFDAVQRGCAAVVWRSMRRPRNLERSVMAASREQGIPTVVQLDPAA